MKQIIVGVIVGLLFVLSSCQQPIMPEEKPWREVVLYVFIETLQGPDNMSIDTIEYTDPDGDTVSLSNVPTEVLSWPTHEPTKTRGWKKTISYDEYQRMTLRVVDSAIASGAGTVDPGDISGNQVTNTSLSNVAYDNGVVEIAGTLYEVVNNDTESDIVELNPVPVAGAFTAYYPFRIKMGWAALNRNLYYVDYHGPARLDNFTSPPVVLDATLSGEIY